MRNDFFYRPVFSFRVSFSSLILFLLCTASLSAQTFLVVSQGSGNDITITTDISKDPIDTQNGESSYGFFYRIEGAPDNNNDGILTNDGAYYWKDDVKYASGTSAVTTLTKTIQLPPGKYSLVAYQSRKSKPIKTIPYVSTNNDPIFEVVQTPNSTNAFQQASWGTITPMIKLENSWNVFTDPSNAAIDNQYTNPASQTPAFPWLFVSLTLQNWLQNSSPAILKYNDEFFEYAGAIVGNKVHSDLSPSWVSDIDTTLTNQALPGIITIRPGATPANSSGQTHIHLMFKRQANARNLDDVQFIASREAPGSSGAIYYTDTLLLSVKPKPHDPNNLRVNIKNICPCQPPKTLLYRIEFQNIGTGPVNNIHVVFMNTIGLDMKTLRIANSSLNTPFTGQTGKKKHQVSFSAGPSTRTGVSVEPGTREVYKFDMPGINLSGTNEYPAVADEKTWDFIEFYVETSKCLKEGTFIRPSARVFFEGAGFLDTNMEETKISSAGGQIVNEVLVPCPGGNSMLCRGCVSKPTEVEIKIKH